MSNKRGWHSGRALPFQGRLDGSDSRTSLHPLPWPLEDYREVALKYGYQAIQVCRGDKYCEANGEDSYVNRSFIAHPEIYLGIYDDEELKSASFFHELGHVVLPKDFTESVNNYTPDIERECWRLGFEVARVGYGIEFPTKVYEWAEKQIQSYVEGWERERAYVLKRQ